MLEKITGIQNVNQIAKSIADVAGTLNIEKHDVSISSIRVRNEKLKLKQMMLMSI